MKNRMVNTRFWQDAYISNLDPTEKLLFLYCLTNNYSTLCGIYEIPLKLIAAETGIDKDMVEKIFSRFQRDGKLAYKDGWLVIRNFVKHHEQGSPHVRVAIEKDLANAPDWARNFVFGEGIDTLSPLALALALAPALASTPKGEATASRGKHDPLGADIIKAFEAVDPKNKGYYGNTTQRAACDFLLAEYGLDEVLKRVSVLPRTNAAPFFPRIYTPVQLKEKWKQLEDAARSKRTEAINKKPKVLV